MGRKGRGALTSRKRATSRLRKLRGSLKGKPSVLDALLKQRRKDLQKEESRRND